MANRDILAIGTSAGGSMPCVTWRVNFRPICLPRFWWSSTCQTNFPRIGRDTHAGSASQATFASDGEALQKNHIYLAPPGRHLLVGGARLSATGIRRSGKPRSAPSTPSSAPPLLRAEKRRSSIDRYPR